MNAKIEASLQGQNNGGKKSRMEGSKVNVTIVVIRKIPWRINEGAIIVQGMQMMALIDSGTQITIN